MINPFEVNAAGIYILNDFYSHNGSSGSSQGKITLYPDNRIIGSAMDTDNSFGVNLRRNIFGLYDPYNGAIELIKIKDGRWSPIVWKVSKNKPFSRTFEGEYQGHWISSFFVEEVLEFNSHLEELCKIGIDKLKEVNVEALKHFFNLHIRGEFDEIGRIIIQRQNNL